MTDLAVEFSGLRFKNPIAAASGPITSTPYTLRQCIEHGVSAVTVKSVSLDEVYQLLPRPGNWFLDRVGERGGLMHCYAGILPQEKALEYIAATKPLAESEDARIIGSFFFIGPWTGVPPFEAVSPPVEEPLREMALQMQEAGADAIELACTCGYSLNASETVTYLEEAIPTAYRALSGHLKIPFWLKLGFNHDVFHLRNIGVMRELGASAMHTYSDFRITYLDIENARPPLPSPFGYGRWLRGVANYASYLSAYETGMQVINSGGIWTWRDAVERLMCGATIAELESPVQYRGYRVFDEMIEGLTRFLERKGYGSVTEIIGAAAPMVDNAPELMVQFGNGAVDPHSLLAVLDEEKCNGCGRCAGCIYGAVAFVDKKPRFDLEMCERCGACITICPTEALSLVPAG
jgi:dihydroorotate dehydrogenase/Pyruvate/2-oxoacid:ferredoxin oxidoreductase delta subunit